MDPKQRIIDIARDLPWWVYFVMAWALILALSFAARAYMLSGAIQSPM